MKINFNNGKQTFITGYTIALYYGLINEQSWTSTLSITRTISIIVISLLHFGLKLVLDYETLKFLEILTITHYILFLTNHLCMCLAILYKSKSFIELNSMIKYEFKHPSTGYSLKYEEIQRNTNKFLAKFMKIVYPIFLWGSLATQLRRPLLDRETEMTTLYNGWLPFKIDTWSRYISVCIFQSLMATSAGSGSCLVLLLFVIQASQLCAQGQILCEYIKDTFAYETNVEESQQQREEFIKLRLKCIIQRTHNLLRNYDLFRDVYSLFLFARSLFTGILMCQIVYMLMDPNTDLTVYFEFASLVPQEFINVGCYCWFGQTLTDRWTQIRETIYEIDWYRESINSQKALLLILTGTTRKQTITGAGLQEFSMKGFSELLQVAFSYLNMCRAMR